MQTLQHTSQMLDKEKCKTQNGMCRNATSNVHKPKREIRTDILRQHHPNRDAYIHTYVYTYIYTHMHHLPTLAFMSWPQTSSGSIAHTEIHTHIHTYIHTYIHTHGPLTNASSGSIAHTEIHTHIHTYTHTHIHTYMDHSPTLAFMSWPQTSSGSIAHTELGSGQHILYACI
jgi:hypothetical protein